jgi:hypothetical protein
MRNRRLEHVAGAPISKAACLDVFRYRGGRDAGRGLAWNRKET